MIPHDPSVSGPRRAARRAAAGAVVLCLLAAPALAHPPGGWGQGGGWAPPGPYGPDWSQGGPAGPGWSGGPGGPGGPGGHGGPGGGAWGERPDPALISVTGSGEATVAPDLAVITVGVTVQAGTAAEAMSQNSARQRQVIDALNARGITGRDIQTSNLSLSAVQDYSREGQPPVITGYQAGNMVTIRVRDLPQLGPVLDALVAAGANEIQGISFQRDDATGTEAEARRRAVDNARERAEVIAEAAGQRLGRLVALSDAPGNGPGPIPMRMRAMAADAGAAPPVEAGELSLSAQITGTWELLPAKGGTDRDSGRGGQGQDGGGHDDDAPDRGGDDFGGGGVQPLPPVTESAPAAAPAAPGAAQPAPAPVPAPPSVAVPQAAPAPIPAPAPASEAVPTPAAPPAGAPPAGVVPPELAPATPPAN